MATEKQLQEGIQAVVRGSDYFDDFDVVINDWSVLDRSHDQAPYLIIMNTNDFDARMDTATATTDYAIPALLVVVLSAEDWKTAYDNLRDARQDIINVFNEEGTARSANNLDGVNITRIFSLTEISYLWPQGVDPEIDPDATPEYITQFIGFQVEQF